MSADELTALEEAFVEEFALLSRRDGFHIAEYRLKAMAFADELTLYWVEGRYGSDTLYHYGEPRLLSNKTSNKQTILKTCRKRESDIRHDSLTRRLMQFVVPLFSHRLTIDPPSDNDLHKMDKTLRGAVQKILLLADCTIDDLLYSRKRNGGLGFLELGVQVKICALCAGVQLLSAADIAWGDRCVRQPRSQTRGSSEQLGMEYPASSLGESCKLKKRYMVDGQPLRPSAPGRYGAEEIGNFCLLNQTALKPDQLIDALQTDQQHALRVHFQVQWQ